MVSSGTFTCCSRYRTRKNDGKENVGKEEKRAIDIIIIVTLSRVDVFHHDDTFEEQSRAHQITIAKLFFLVNSSKVFFFFLLLRCLLSTRVSQLSFFLFSLMICCCSYSKTSTTNREKDLFSEHRLLAT